MSGHPIAIKPDKKLTIIDSKAQITLQNDSLNGYGYKIRTTCPNSYKVEPNIGILRPLANLKITVTTKETPPGCNDKFNILIYEFDHKKSVEDLKLHISNAKTPLISRILQVERIRKEIIQEDTGTFELFIAISLIIVSLPTLIRRFLTL